MLQEELETMDVEKEALTVRKNMLKRHGIELGKREVSDKNYFLPVFEPIKRAKIAERFV